LTSFGTFKRSTWHFARLVAEGQQGCHLAQQGWTFQAIAQQGGWHRKTVAPYGRSDSFPVRARPPSVLDPYKPYLLAC
jgi:hypothetical protein